MNRVEALGVAIKEARAKKQLSQEKLAELAKLHRNSVGLVERNLTKLAVDSLFAIADALGTTAAELVARAETLAGDDRSL
ncbi:helix-turn-helix domain-containing protein [Noviherbaspirillum pedocola]|uniref:Helix-turn-helix transcriptional regulator n=1 Tax=Noviherbaspirillum pedocola TaxID=2801341 RepID=A0A934SVG6_9BURK|nr:helix-turn-helix transcriptional regulator [Noviherbaspirillum pedocola]